GAGHRGGAAARRPARAGRAARPPVFRRACRTPRCPRRSGALARARPARGKSRAARSRASGSATRPWESPAGIRRASKESASRAQRTSSRWPASSPGITWCRRRCAECGSGRPRGPGLRPRIALRCRWGKCPSCRAPRCRSSRRTIPCPLSPPGRARRRPMCRFRWCPAGAHCPRPGDCSPPTPATAMPPARGRGGACQRFVVVEGLVDGVTPELLPVEPLPIEPLLPPLVEPGPPMELVLPDVSLLLLVEPGVLVLPPLVPPPMALVLPLPVLPPMELLPPVLPGVLELLLEVEVSGAGLV